MSSSATLTASPINDAAPAGWYHDPLGLPQVRWWNGLMWTNEVQAPRPEVQVSAAYKTPVLGMPS